ncbi:hypothetical protein AaE_000106 [Aphanomyces astaci]|uniref:Uncharacterized protein n=1 Tax=Aphanomyces astaci TaxID=112090 RepID=A0A6A5AZW7_APHAT|nr:hypothetical protein AaE_000106 [Aphanomyces astaci]
MRQYITVCSGGNPPPIAPTIPGEKPYEATTSTLNNSMDMDISDDSIELSVDALEESCDFGAPGNTAASVHNFDDAFFESLGLIVVPPPERIDTPKASPCYSISSFSSLEGRLSPTAIPSTPPLPLRRLSFDPPKLSFPTASIDLHPPRSSPEQDTYNFQDKGATSHFVLNETKAGPHDRVLVDEWTRNSKETPEKTAIREQWSKKEAKQESTTSTTSCHECPQQAIRHKACRLGRYSIDLPVGRHWVAAALWTIVV